jgi:hypothetical protein
MKNTFNIDDVLGFIEHEKNRFFLDSQKDGLGVYANTVLMTEEQYKALLTQSGLIHYVENYEINIKSVCGLKLVLCEHLEKPKLLRIEA